MSVERTHSQSVFHDGEIAVHEKSGFGDQSLRITERIIRPFMPDQHRQFFEQLPFMFFGLLDRQGMPWALPVFGAPGFVTSPDDISLEVKGLPVFYDQLDIDISVGAKIGGLGIELLTRRRNRMNGVITTKSDDQFTIKVDQSFGNCPKYIHQRALYFGDVPHINIGRQVVEFHIEVTQKIQDIIKRADTFFIASRSAQISDDPRNGVDVSHRGGKSGFIKIVGEDRLYVPDFSGNRFFNTLGNIHSDGRIGLYICDFETGDVVLIGGRAEIIWDGALVDQFEGAERVIDIRIERVGLVQSSWLFRSEFVDLGPHLDKTGSWG